MRPPLQRRPPLFNFLLSVGSVYLHGRLARTFAPVCVGRLSVRLHEAALLLLEHSLRHWSRTFFSGRLAPFCSSRVSIRPACRRQCC
jgi:hypothetical protein